MSTLAALIKYSGSRDDLDADERALFDSMKEDCSAGGDADVEQDDGDVEEENDEDMAEEGKFPMNTICCY